MGLRSSVDRALVSGTKGRRFESCRGHDYDWVVLSQPSFLRFTTPKVGTQGRFSSGNLFTEKMIPLPKTTGTNDHSLIVRKQDK